MIVSAWTDGGSTYGLRILKEDISLYFQPGWEQVLVRLPDRNEPVVVTLTESFWSTAPELRSPQLKAFFTRNGVIPWEKNHPPRFELQRLGEASFRLNWLEKPRGQPQLPLE